MNVLKNFPKMRQAFTYSCGASAMQAVLAYYGFDVREGEIIKILKTSKKGTSIKGFSRAAKKFGLRYREGRLRIRDLRENIDKARPTIIAIQAWKKKKVADWTKEWSSGHFVIPIGYTKKSIFFEDPSCIVRTSLTKNELRARWHDINYTPKKTKLIRWGIVFYGKKPIFHLKKAVPMGFASYSLNKSKKKVYRVRKKKYQRFFEVL